MESSILANNKEILNKGSTEDLDKKDKKLTKTDKIIINIQEGRKIHWNKYKVIYIIGFIMFGIFIISYFLNLLSQNNIFDWLTKHKDMFQTIYTDVSNVSKYLFVNGIGALITHFVHLLKK